MIVGAVVVPAGAGGTLLGGYIGKRWDLTRSGFIKMYIICQTVVIPLYLGFLLYCPNGAFAGLTATDVAGHAYGPALDFASDCNGACAANCRLSEFDPVCSVADDVTFFNPCFAGCRAAKNESVFTDCACLSPVEGVGPWAGLGGVATRGQCESGKCGFALFAGLMFLQIFFTFMATMPGLVASLR